MCRRFDTRRHRTLTPASRDVNDPHHSGLGPPRLSSTGVVHITACSLSLDAVALLTGGTLRRSIVLRSAQVRVPIGGNGMARDTLDQFVGARRRSGVAIAEDDLHGS